MSAHSGIGLSTIGERLRTQDNRLTDQPIFLVQQKRRIYGIDADWASAPMIWLFDGDEITGRKAKRLEGIFQKTRHIPSGHSRTGYVDVWDTCTACFTEEGCRSYLKENGHNLKEPRVYVVSGHRNGEWKTLRKFLMEL